MNRMSSSKEEAWLVSTDLAIKMNKFTIPKEPQELKL